VESALDAYTSGLSGCPPRLAEAIRYSLLGPGKRLRPMLALLAAEASGGTWEEALPAACAVEMVHTYSLIHDDLPAMDDDDLRRGRPTCHRVFGEAMAILAGDALLALAFEVLSMRMAQPAVAARACAVLSRAAGPRALVGGQADDLAAESAPGGLDLLEEIHRKKTGAMILAAVELGGLAAGASAEQAEALARYGRCMGLAFQIVDDLLDVRGNESRVGKRLQKDQKRGKLTCPGLVGVEESEARARRLTTEACRALGPLGESARGLVLLAEFVMERDR
jgi:geranylgeranyl diphosphate synthase type II